MSSPLPHWSRDSLCPGQLPPLRHPGPSQNLLGEALRKQHYLPFREKEAFSSLSVPVTPRVTKNPPSSGDIPWQWDDLREGQQGSQVLKPGVCS